MYINIVLWDIPDYTVELADIHRTALIKKTGGGP